MKLQDKIFYCRKKAGLSQESLSVRIGVSRQAISKWETGDAEPEINKLRFLASTFGVTTDWLLNEDEPEEERTAASQSASAQSMPSANWVDSIPGALGKLLRKYGWLFGVYLAVGGAAFTGIGALARYLTRQMLTGFDGGTFGAMDNMFSGGTIYYDQFGNQMHDAFSSMASNNPVSIMGTFIMIVGIVMMIAGIVLAIVLKKRCQDK